MAAENVAFYPHNLAPEHMIHSRTELHFCAALGYQMSFDLNQGVSPWLDVAGLVQRHLLAPTVGVAITAFDDAREGNGTTRMVWADGTEVVANWSTTASITEGAATMGPEGFWFRRAEPRTEGGWVEAYNGTPVGAADGRLLVVSREEDAVAVRSVTDAPFTVALPGDWFPGGPGRYVVTREAADGARTTEPVDVTAAGVSVTYGAGDRALVIARGESVSWRAF
jgi:hypothetical protein